MNFKLTFVKVDLNGSSKIDKGQIKLLPHAVFLYYFDWHLINSYYLDENSKEIYEV